MKLTTFYRAIAVFLLNLVLLFVLSNFLAGVVIHNFPDLRLTNPERLVRDAQLRRVERVAPEVRAALFGVATVDDLKAMEEELLDLREEFVSYVHFRRREASGDFVNLSGDGYRHVRDQGPWPPSSGNFNVFFFGGSTSYHPGPDWASVPSQLQELLNAAGGFDQPVKVYNFGQGAYQSTQERVLLSLLLRDGHRPDAVIFLDGLNDFCFYDGKPVNWQWLKLTFDSHLNNHLDGLFGSGLEAQWTHLEKWFYALPITQLARGLADLMVYEAPEYVDADELETLPREDSDPAAIDRTISMYFNHLRQTEALAQAYGFVPIFVWQPIPSYKYDRSHHLFYPNRLACHVHSRDGYPIMAQRVAAEAMPQGFIWAADLQTGKKEPLYVDGFHYSMAFAGEIARFIFETARERGLWSK